MSWWRSYDHLSGRRRAPDSGDALIAAIVELAGAVVLHVDKDFELIAEITQQPTERLSPVSLPSACLVPTSHTVAELTKISESTSSRSLVAESSVASSPSLCVPYRTVSGAQAAAASQLPAAPDPTVEEVFRQWIRTIERTARVTDLAVLDEQLEASADAGNALSGVYDDF